MDFEAFNNRDLFLRMWCDRLWDHWYCSAAFVVDTFGGAANRKTQGGLCLRRHCRHSGVLRLTKPRRKPQIVPQIAFHCRHTTPRGKSRRKPRTANRSIVDVPIMINDTDISPGCKILLKKRVFQKNFSQISLFSKKIFLKFLLAKLSQLARW